MYVTTWASLRPQRRRPSAEAHRQAALGCKPLNGQKRAKWPKKPKQGAGKGVVENLTGGWVVPREQDAAQGMSFPRPLEILIC